MFLQTRGKSTKGGGFNSYFGSVQSR
ncbi:hypothetical protein Pint_08301 [Pistacia integerrima]|uniref:Uncharacterized protein n=1 Tax=Pistacia integerrima TaxID=434235 RepID=A0ACC0XYB5_9ROSI|nr:hypothetical protein Pint_08301 [Pistacia integerrima]